MIASCRRYFALDRLQRGLVIEASVLMCLGWIGLRLFRFVTLRRAFDRLVASTSPSRQSVAEDVVPRVRRAVTAVASRCAPATCLVQALAADAMLRRRQVSCTVRFGVRFGGTAGDPLEGHAWVECGGSAIDASDSRLVFSVLSR